MKLKHTLFNGASVAIDNLENVESIAGAIATLACVKSMWPMQSYGPPSTRLDWVGRPGMHTQHRDSLGARATINDAFTPHVMTQVDKLRSKGVTGKGIKVAVIDSGVSDFSVASSDDDNGQDTNSTFW